jgi:hypothetical protein
VELVGDCGLLWWWFQAGWVEVVRDRRLFRFVFSSLEKVRSKLNNQQMSKKKSIGEQLCDAADAGNVAELRRLIEGGADVNATYGVRVYMCWHVHSSLGNPRNMMNPVTTCGCVTVRRASRL